MGYKRDDAEVVNRGDPRKKDKDTDKGVCTGQNPEHSETEASKVIEPKTTVQDSIGLYTSTYTRLYEGDTDHRLGCALNSVLNILYILFGGDAKLFKIRTKFVGMDRIIRDLIVETNKCETKDSDSMFGRRDEAPRFLKTDYGYNGLLNIVAFEKCLRSWFPDKRFVIMKTWKSVNTLHEAISGCDHNDAILVQGVLSRELIGKRRNHIRYVRVRHSALTEDRFDIHFESSIVLQNYTPCKVKSRLKLKNGQEYHPPQYQLYPRFYSNCQREKTSGRILEREIEWLDTKSTIGTINADSFMKVTQRFWTIQDKSDVCIGQMLIAECQLKNQTTVQRATVTLGGSHMVLPFAYVGELPSPLIFLCTLCLH